MKKIKAAAEVLSMIAAIPLLVVAEITHGIKATGQMKESGKEKITSHPVLLPAPAVSERTANIYQYPTCITISI